MTLIRLLFVINKLIMQSLTADKDKFTLDDSDIPHLTDEVYEIIRTIKDPEFPNTLEELDVVDPEGVSLSIN